MKYKIITIASISLFALLLWFVLWHDKISGEYEIERFCYEEGA